MPHSGGGGSHSGGSHSSGRVSHSSGPGGGGRSYRHSSRPFSGSRAYVIYNRAGQSRAVYTDQPNYHEEMTKESYIMSLMFGVCFLVPGAIAILTGLGMMISSVPFGYRKTTAPSSVDQSIEILDTWGHLSANEKGETKLRTLLQKELARANGTEVGEVMAQVFDEYRAYYESKGWSVDIDRLLPAAFMCIWERLFGGGGVTMLLSARKQYQKSQQEGVKTYKINGIPKILYCAYCGSSYYAGTI